MTHCLQYVYDNRLPILAAAGMVVSSGVMTLPKPGAVFSFYEWFYDWTHQFMNLRNPRFAAGEGANPK